MFRDIETKTPKEFFDTIQKYKKHGYKIHTHIGMPQLKEMQVVIMQRGTDIVGVSIWNTDFIRNEGK